MIILRSFKQNNIAGTIPTLYAAYLNPLIIQFDLLTEMLKFDIIFSLNIDIHLPSFYKKSLTKVAEIPFGETTSYKSIAIKIGNPNASRAVGNANANNPLPIIIPCHRVIANDGSIGGYGGGLKTKRFLLELEGAL